MTKRDRKALCEYIRWVANEIELRDWEFQLMHEPAGGDCYARIVNTYGRKLSQIYVCENFRELSPEQQRHTIVHELVHPHLEGACNMVQNDLEEHLGKQADKLFWEAYKRQVEYGVDALATAIAKHLPLIDWPT